MGDSGLDAESETYIAIKDIIGAPGGLPGLDGGVIWMLHSLTVIGALGV